MRKVSRYIQVGVTAMRDPLTGEPMEAVPLYVDAEGGESQLPEIRLDEFARIFMRKFREQKKTASAATLTE